MVGKGDTFDFHLSRIPVMTADLFSLISD